MSETYLAQEDGYSGASHPWLNRDGSYHRMVYEDRTHIYTLSEASELVMSLKNEFLEWSQSRMVIRIISSIKENEELHILDKFIYNNGWQMWYYRNHQPNSPYFLYITISFNKDSRWLNSDLLFTLTEKNRIYIDRLLNEIGSFEEYNLQKLRNFSSRWFEITSNLNPRELVTLWWDSFGWSEKACEDILSSSDGSFPIGVRDCKKKLIAAVLYSHQPHILESGDIILHWETTEASTLPEYQWNGIMPILVTWLHVKVLEQWIYNIYGELRAEDITGDKPNSINHGLKSGKVFNFPKYSSPILVNHVSISGKDESYNWDRLITWYNSSPPWELRSFLIWEMDPKKLSQKILLEYRNIIS